MSRLSRRTEDAAIFERLPRRKEAGEKFKEGEKSGPNVVTRPPYTRHTDLTLLSLSALSRAPPFLYCQTVARSHRSSCLV